MMPALLIRMSMRPNSSSTVWTTFAGVSLSAMSPPTATALDPRSETLRHVAAASSSLRAWQATFAPASASATAIARPMPAAEPVTSATLPSSLKLSRIIKYELFLRGFEPRAFLSVFGLDVDDSELAVDTLAVRGHHPEKIDRAAGSRHIRVVTLRHQDDVAFAYNLDQLGF